MFYFSVPKDVRLNSTRLIMKINNKRELQNIAINYSADIDYKDFMKIYRECTEEPYSFLTSDATLPASNPLRLRKNLFHSYKIIVADQLKVLDRKVKRNEAQYDLDRKAAKISALSSNNLDKYEYLTGEDLELKPSTIEQKKFEYSPLRKCFNRVLREEDKKEGLLKRLKNIDNKNEEQLKAIKSKTGNIKEVTDFVEEPLSLEANGLIEEIKIIQKDVDYRKLKITGGNKIKYHFSDYKTFKELFRDLYYRNISIYQEGRKQDEFDGSFGALSAYSAKRKEDVETKNKLLNNTKNFYKGREKIIEGFKNGIFSLNYDEQEKQEHKDKEEENIRDGNGLIDYKRLKRLIDLKNIDPNDELVRKNFKVHDLVSLLEKLKNSKNNTERNDIQANLIKSGLREKIEDMSEHEKEIENPDVIVDIVEKILEFNNQQRGQGLKILTPSQMLSRLPISLAQLKAGNNFENLKNEIRQVLYSLHKSRKLT